jgi:hypothetical protein
MMGSPIRTLAVILTIAGVSACAASRPPVPQPTFISAPNPAEVESVIFLVGDGGEIQRQTSPLLTRLQQDVESWSAMLSDSAVTVLFLGDIVYPLGLNPPGSPEFPRDSAVVMDQVSVLAGPAALERGARGFFLAGNHDWGLEEDWEGFARIQALSDLLYQASQETGAPVRFAPDAGTGGPYTVDVGDYIRILMLDTAWWVLDGGQLGTDTRGGVLDGINDALSTAGDRHVLIAAHHPFRSAGPHGGEFSFWRTLGIRYLLTRSGAMLQDLTSIPYREFETGLRSIIARTKPPLAFIGGHEHSLQVFQAVEPTDPTFSLVSGSASKLSSIGVQPGMLFGSATPGYMRLVVERGGGVTLFVESAAAEYQDCGEAADLATCMAAGAEAFDVVYSQRLR